MGAMFALGMVCTYRRLREPIGGHGSTYVVRVDSERQAECAEILLD